MQGKYISIYLYKIEQNEYTHIREEILDIMFYEIFDDPDFL